MKPRLSAVIALVIMLAVLAAPTTAEAATRTVTFSGAGRTVTAATTQRLKVLPKSFRSYLHRSLVAMDRQAGSGCANTSSVTVKRWRSDGWALLTNSGTFGRCASGGVQQILQRVHGRWTAPGSLATQEAYQCTVLVSKRVPRALLGGSCYDRDGNLVPYASFR